MTLTVVTNVVGNTKKWLTNDRINNIIMAAWIYLFLDRSIRISPEPKNTMCSTPGPAFFGNNPTQQVIKQPADILCISSFEGQRACLWVERSKALPP